ncbi:hypothetical protein AVL60_08920 [Kocuria palustris]|nr:hypothetical protein AVL60_08920 [Kocuria palustris]GLU85478.1 hypothetical protein Kosp01_02240 [Kocuria sp. NBRC 114282]
MNAQIADSTSITTAPPTIPVQRGRGAGASSGGVVLFMQDTVSVKTPFIFTGFVTPDDGVDHI